MSESTLQDDMADIAAGRACERGQPPDSEDGWRAWTPKENDELNTTNRQGFDNNTRGNNTPEIFERPVSAQDERDWSHIFEALERLVVAQEDRSSTGEEKSGHSEDMVDDDNRSFSGPAHNHETNAKTQGDVRTVVWADGTTALAQLVDGFWQPIHPIHCDQHAGGQPTSYTTNAQPTINYHAQSAPGCHELAGHDMPTVAGWHQSAQPQIPFIQHPMQDPYVQHPLRHQHFQHPLQNPVIRNSVQDHHAQPPMPAQYTPQFFTSGGVPTVYHIYHFYDTAYAQYMQT